MLSRRLFIRHLLVGMAALAVGGWEKLAGAEGREYYRLVVLGDPHLPVRVHKHPKASSQQAIRAAKDAVIADINGWNDVAAVAVVGDIVGRLGVQPEYDYIRTFFSKLDKKCWVINGNHEFMLEDTLQDNGKAKVASPSVWRKKLAYFAAFWQLPQRWYTKELGRYHLVFLSAEGPRPVQIGAEQLAWFREDLAKNRAKTTLVFFHGPLEHTLLKYKKSIDTEKSIAMPADAIDAILAENPQVRLWVSGHTHTPCHNSSYANREVNRYNAHTYAIHNDCMDRKKITTNSIYLYKDHIEVRTFDHKHKKWLPEFDRSFSC